MTVIMGMCLNYNALCNDLKVVGVHDQHVEHDKHVWLVMLN